LKALLIRPPAPNTLSFIKIVDCEPLELEYLHTALQEAGHTDYIYDGLIERDSIETVLKREKPDLVAITGYITQEKLMLSYAKLAKTLNPNTVTAIGGVHAQINYQRFFDPHVDYICRSESIDVLVSLMNHLQGKEVDVSALNGLCHQENGSFVVNDLRPVCINTLPIPDRTFFYQHKHEYRYLELTEVASIKTAFSCPYSCNFCYCTQLNGGRYAARDLELVIEELEGLDAQNVQIVDDDFLLDCDRLEHFIRLVKERNIRKTFLCYARADFVAAHPELVTELVEIGFRYFLVGLEAASDADLEKYNKGTSVDINKRCVEVIHSTKADCLALMIVPLDATREHFDHIYRWIVENRLKYVTVSIFTPIPGTPLYETYKDKLITHDIEEWDFLHLVVEPEHMSVRNFYKEYYRLLIKLFRIARKTGIYSFMDLEFYKNMLVNYFRRKARDRR